ncbi:FHA domain-containing protein [Halomonas denitrificans]|nr:FHA domain-containing protein [Halomonas denitrificans]
MNYRLKGASGPMTGRTFDIGDGLTIGSAPDADIRDAALESRHARIRVDDDALVLEADGPVEVNGEAVRRRALESGDELRIATLRFVLQAPGLKPARVLEPVEAAGSGGRWGWLLAAGAAAAAGAAGWWFLLGPGGGAAG